MSAARRTLLLAALFFLKPSPAFPGDFRKLGQEVLEIVRDHFYDPKKAAAWTVAHEGYGAGEQGRDTFVRRTNGFLDELGTSHTDYYTPRDPEYSMLLAIFHKPLKLENVEYEGIGVDAARSTEGAFVRTVFGGSPAEKAGIKRGDLLVKADGGAFDPVASFQGAAGRAVTLTIERRRDQPPMEVQVIPRRINPRKEWLESQRLGSRIIERNGKKIAYAPLWSCTGEEYQESLQDAIVESFQDADALILDFRDGWGGCGPEFLNLFNTHIPVFTEINPRGGNKPTTQDIVWRKPLFVLVNHGTRSGKEMVVFAIKKHKIGTLIGERTAGAYMGGLPFLLSDRSLLLVAVGTGLVDGQRLEGVGVEPDVVIADSLAYADGNDAQLEKALSLAGGASLK